MADAELSVVTGALDYTGRYIARGLIERGARVRTLTAHPNKPNPFGDRIEIAPLDFAAPESLARGIEGATTLFNTYWIRFPYRETTFETAVENSSTLLHAAQCAGVRRIVHVSITGADVNSPLPYFRGKGLVEREITQSQLSWAILRPTLVFGVDDVLLNNIAWLVRRFPLFALPGLGSYRVQPVCVTDLAALAISSARGAENRIVDAVGPEIYTFRDLVRTVACALNRSPLLMPVPSGVALFLSRLIGYAIGDVMLTRDEIDGLAASLLISAESPTCPTALSSWLASNADSLGRTYNSELARRFGARSGV
jgi:NADH dehydrogenase